MKSPPPFIAVLSQSACLQTDRLAGRNCHKYKPDFKDLSMLRSRQAEDPLLTPNREVPVSRSYEMSHSLFVLEEVEGTGDWRELLKEKLHNL